MTDENIPRRAIVSTGGVVLTSSLAGCSILDNQTSDNVNPDNSDNINKEEADKGGTDSQPSITSYKDTDFNNAWDLMEFLDRDYINAEKAALTGYQEDVYEDVFGAGSGFVRESPDTVSGFDTSVEFGYSIAGEKTAHYQGRFDLNQMRSHTVEFDRNRLPENTWGTQPWDFGVRRVGFHDERGGYLKDQRLDGTVEPELSHPSSYFDDSMERLVDASMNILRYWIDHSGVNLSMTNDFPATISKELEPAKTFESQLPKVRDVDIEVEIGSWLPVRRVSLTGRTENNEDVSAYFRATAGYIDVSKPEWVEAV